VLSNSAGFAFARINSSKLGFFYPASTAAMRFQSYFNVAASLIMNYAGDSPFSQYLKQYFAKHKKHGSTDRKCIAHICYSYFRLGHCLKECSIHERMQAALVLCPNESREWSSLPHQDWMPAAGLSIDQRIAWIQRTYPAFSIQEIFPWLDELSEGVDHQSFCRSFLSQPELFIRIRPGYATTVKSQLEAASITFRSVTASCLALNNTSRIDTLLELNKEAVIQDFNSQRVGAFFQLPAAVDGQGKKLWDCCSGSGGKSILAIDLLPSFDLTVSDIRKSILLQLKKRFKEAGINRYKAITIDLSAGGLPDLETDSPGAQFDLIIADLPCSGSGTWARTPEELAHFDPQKIEQYALLQRKILTNVLPQLKKGGQLVYITCSVFKKENEEISRFIKEEFQLRPENQQLLIGYPCRADTMFVADFQL
jgi:16S rRNA (cytosine967-C5)-methyltransferase